MFQTFKTRFKSYLMYFLWSILGKLLGFSVFLVLDTLTSISCHLRAIGSRLNARFNFRNIECSVNAMFQREMVLRVSF